jgi:hypothetical protein
MLSNRAMHGWIIVVIAIVAALSLEVWSAAAQDPTTPDQPPMMGPGRGRMSNDMMGRGMHQDSMMHWMMGMPYMPGRSTMFDAVAAALDLEPAALAEALQSGKTLTEIADAQGVEIQVVVDAIIAVRQEHINGMIEQGMITETQAAQWLENMSAVFPEHLEQMFWGNYGRGQSQGHFENCPFFEALSQDS